MIDLKKTRHLIPNEEVAESVVREIEDLRIFAIWLMKCGYDFTQHQWFLDERDRLLIDEKDSYGIRGL